MCRLIFDVALLDINDVEGLADFVVEWMRKAERISESTLDKTRQRRIRPFSAPAQKRPVFRLGLLLNLMPGSSLLSWGTHTTIGATAFHF